MHNVARRESIADLMERWARWRFGRSEAIGRPVSGGSLTGRLMSGMRSTVCPACKGHGKLPGHLVGSSLVWIDPCPQCYGAKRVNGDLAPETKIRVEICGHCTRGENNGRTCHRCRGSGERVIVTQKVNPASIPSTVPPTGNNHDDPLSERVDRVVASWRQNDRTLSLYFVVIEEYTKNGRQSDKADRCHISQGYYSKLLTQAHDLVQQGIDG